ncbi:MAG: alpha/beta hydrolase [Xanthobacteraceae bacterium]|nr:alpha/beta hydrolase [Xanthobacteraceae bacterium]MCW5678798.1 alpha/beta hydrolase [Xanthobacteraceae bacterium]
MSDPLMDLISGSGAVSPDPLLSIDARVEHHYADNEGVKIHYAALGKGPLVVMMHGFPDYWMSWRHQMDALSKQFRAVAFDMRGYNLSDKPKGVENYSMRKLVSDCAAVVAAEGAKKAVIIGHDWGGATAWNVGMRRPDITERLIVLNMPHPWTLAKQLAENPEQQKNSQYARNFQDPEFYKKISLERLGAWVADPEARALHRAAMERSDPQAMLHYYQANYPAPPYAAPTAPPPKVKAPTLLIHGMEDKALLSEGLNGVWDFVEQDFTLATIPGAGHFVQQDAADAVSRTILAWLNR